MPETQSRSAALFEELVQELVKEGQETGQFQIDSMRFAQMEMLDDVEDDDPRRIRSEGDHVSDE